AASATAQVDLPTEPPRKDVPAPDAPAGPPTGPGVTPPGETTATEGAAPPAGPLPDAVAWGLGALFLLLLVSVAVKLLRKKKAERAAPEVLPPKRERIEPVA